MRALTIATAATLLAATVVVLPVVSVGASAHAVSPEVERLGMPAGVQVRRVPAPNQPGQSGGAPATVTESLLTRDTKGADVVGVGFPDRASAEGVSIEVRSRMDGAWGPWTSVGFSDSAPDHGTPEAGQAKVATEPVGVTGSDRVQVRVQSRRASARLERVRVTFVDGGTSAADRWVARTPAASARAAAAQPTIVTRAEWGADESLRTCAPRQVPAIQGAVVHHTVNSNTYAASDVPALLRGIYAYHVTGNGWCDVGYNFFVDRFGRLFEGRFGGMYKNVVGAQAAGFNSQTFGVSSIGNHDPGTAGAVAPSSTVQSAIGKLIGWKAWLNGWDPSTLVSYTSAGSSRWPKGTVISKPRVSGHRDFNLTTCPGDLMFSKLSSIRSTATSVYKAGVTDANSETASATVVETYTKPAGTSIAIAGRGYGHGRGMSQYGAYGAAQKGLTRDQILAFYYPNTTRSATLGNPMIRVRVTVIGSSTRVRYQSGLSATDGKRSVSLGSKNADGSVRSEWRVLPNNGGLSLQYYYSGAWRGLAGWVGLPTPITLQNPTVGSLRVAMPDSTQRDYRGSIRTHLFGASTLPVNLVPLDSYLQSVVPSEMPASWSPAALESQAVAARTFAIYQKAHQPTGSLYDTCDTTSCQVYKGMATYSTSLTRSSYEYASSTAAVKATSGLGVFYGGVPALTQFGSSNGGQTVSSSLVYQVSKADPYDNVPSGSSSRWTASLSVSKIQSAYPTTGTFKALRIDKRDGYNTWGGRISSLTIIGSSGSKTVSGDSFRSTMGLRSNWWTVTSAPATSAKSWPKDLDGNKRADLLAVDTSSRLRLLSGNGSSGFSAKTVASGWGSYGLVADVGAWDGDNRHDVVEREGSTLYYHPGNGTGGLFPRVAIGTGWDTVDLVSGTGDMDRDGHTDFLARTTGGALKLYRGDGKGKVLGTISLGSGWGAYRALLSPGDLTGDGRHDLLGLRTSDNKLLLFPGTGSGTVGSAVMVSGSWSGYSALMASGDVTGDGRDDVVARRSSDGALVVLAGNDMGVLITGATLSGTSTWASWTRWTP